MVRMKEKSSFRKGLERILASGIMFFAILINIVNADSSGALQIYNYIGSKSEFVQIFRDDSSFPGALDNYDEYDGDAGENPDGNPQIYSVIPGHNLWDDIRPEDSNIPYDIKLGYQGTLSSAQSNHIDFSIFGAGFGNKPIIFESDRLPYGPVVDMRRAQDKNSGIIDLIDLPSGTYYQWDPYGSCTVDIGTRLLADLDENGKCNLVDFSLLGNDWGKGPGQYNGDISGPNGIPDGYVDNYDLGTFCEDWLKDANDPNTW